MQKKKVTEKKRHYYYSYYYSKRRTFLTTNRVYQRFNETIILIHPRSFSNISYVTAIPLRHTHFVFFSIKPKKNPLFSTIAPQSFNHLMNTDTEIPQELYYLGKKKKTRK